MDVAAVNAEKTPSSGSGSRKPLPTAPRGPEHHLVRRRAQIHIDATTPAAALEVDDRGEFRPLLPKKVPLSAVNRTVGSPVGVPG